MNQGEQDRKKGKWLWRIGIFVGILIVGNFLLDVPLFHDKEGCILVSNKCTIPRYTPRDYIEKYLEKINGKIPQKIKDIWEPKSENEKLKAVLNGMNPKDIYTLERIPGTEGEEETTAIKISFDNFEKIKDQITVYDKKFTINEKSVAIGNPQEMKNLRTEHPEIRGTVSNDETYFYICIEDYYNNRELLKKYTIDGDTNNNLIIRIKPSDLQNIPPEIIKYSMSRGKNGFLIRRPPYSKSTFSDKESVSMTNFYREKYNKCGEMLTPSEISMLVVGGGSYDPSLYALRLPSELTPNSIEPNEIALYQIKLRPENLPNISEEDANNLYTGIHGILDYDLFSNTSPYSFIVVSTTEEEILKAKAQGIVWWYERYHPAYKMDVRELYKNRTSYSLIYEGKNWISVQLTVSMLEGITAETVAKKREELQKFAEGLGAVTPVTIEKYEGGAIVDFFDSYYDSTNKVFGFGIPEDEKGRPIENSDYLKENFKKLQTVEPRSELAIDWEKYKGQDTFHFLIPAIPQEAIIDLLKREDVLTGDMKYVTYPYGGKNINLF
jgi:hypothetical protein